MKSKSKSTSAAELRPRNGIEAYLTASAAAIWGDFLAFPIDTLKVHMQMHAAPLRTSLRSLAAGGAAAWYRGVHASAFRQATYGGMRLSLYEPIRNVIANASSGNRNSSAKLASSPLGKANTEPLPLSVQLLSGALAGGVSSAVMCPADVVKIRLQAGEARYTSVSHALKQIVQHEGVTQLWRGVGPTSARASAVAAVELGVYDATKTWLVVSRGMPEDSSVYVLASVLATVGSIAVSFPIDVAKTVMINQGVLGVATNSANGTVIANAPAHAHSTAAVPHSTLRGAPVLRASSVGAAALSNNSTAAACLKAVNSSSPSAALHHSSTAALAAPTRAPPNATATAPPHYRHMLHVMWHRFETRGFVGMYRGVGPSLARQLVCNAGMFLGFEQLKKAFWEPTSIP